MAKTLIIYYSRRGQNYVNGSLRELARGNTEIVTEYIQEAIPADVFEIRPVRRYSDDYMKCTEEAKEEQRENARPELQEELHDISAYDNIVVAGPCWWGTYPMAVFTQLEKLDFRGKKVFPVMTHEGSGIRQAEKDLKKICKGAKIGRSLAVHGARAEESGKEITRWAEKYLG